MALIAIINTLPIILERWFKYLLEMKYVFLLLSYRSYHVIPNVITYLHADPSLKFSPAFWVHSHNPALNTIFRQNSVPYPTPQDSLRSPASAWACCVHIRNTQTIKSTHNPNNMKGQNRLSLTPNSPVLEKYSPVIIT